MNEEKELESIEDILEYMGTDDSLLVRNIESGEENEEHWVENLKKYPYQIHITKELFMKCFESEYFYDFELGHKEKEFYFRSYKYNQ